MKRLLVITLANEEGSEQLAGLANSFAVIQKDVLKIPFGKSPNGKYVQDFNRACADEMLANFQTARSEDSAFKIPIYIGHPDHPAFADRFKDNAAYAWIGNMTVGDDALLLNTEWSPDGTNLLNQGKYRYMSPNWDCRVSRDGKTAHPVKLISIGLTNMPNIRAIGALVNQAQQQGETQMKELLLKMLGLANDATGAQIQEAAKDVDVPALKLALVNEKTAREDEKKAADLALANEKAGRETAKAEFDKQINLANAAAKVERDARIEMIANDAITAGKITVAEKPQWVADLQKDLDGTVTRLANAKSSISSSKTKDLGGRKSEVLSRQDKVLALVNEEMKKTGEVDYIKAFGNVKKANAALFAEMEQPKSA